MSSSPLRAKSRLASDCNIKVATRVRPTANDDENLMTVSGNTITISPGAQKSATRAIEPKQFIFDQCFANESNEQIYNNFGKQFLDHGFKGYNACVLAYGQTGSGKSHTMIGNDNDLGIIPRICKDIFERASELESEGVSVMVRISFCEIYNEQIRDLLAPPPAKTAQAAATKLRVRDGPQGTYVDGLSDYMVKSQEQVLKYLSSGSQRRATAATKMNNVSSRSHAVVSLQLRQVKYNGDGTEEVVSLLRLVDLAGSERANATGATGDRLKEGSNINKSLVTLGRVISTLSDMPHSSPAKRKTVSIPYRESVLTRLLQDSLGGNSKTAMIACLSPSSYEQSLSTLRYADQAKRITTDAKVNMDIVSSADADARIEKMQMELSALQQQLVDKESAQKITATVRFYEEQAAANEARCKSLAAQNKAMKTHNELMSDYLREFLDKQGSSPAHGCSIQSNDLLKQVNIYHNEASAAVAKWTVICADL